MRRESNVNVYIKRLGILLAIIGAVYIIMSTTCPLVPCQDINPVTGQVFTRMCPVQACAHGYIYAGLTLWLIGAVLWIGGVYITPEMVNRMILNRKNRYETRRESHTIVEKKVKTKPKKKRASTSKKKTTSKRKKTASSKKRVQKRSKK